MNSGDELQERRKWPSSKSGKLHRKQTLLYRRNWESQEMRYV